jgi:hypothetical protein
MENPMHAMTCRCPTCRRGGAAFEALPFELQSEDEDEAGAGFGARDAESPFSEAEETELAMELLSVASEEELDQFLGKLVKGAWKGLKKVGKAVGKIAKPLGGVLKGLAKKALPFVGGALGTLIPIPGVGTALGSALGSAVSKALEAELVGLQSEERQFEAARRFVRIAGCAAQQAARAADSADPQVSVRQAVLDAARRHVPRLAAASAGSQAGGRWVRRGGQIVIEGA